MALLQVAWLDRSLGQSEHVANFISVAVMLQPAVVAPLNE